MLDVREFVESSKLKTELFLKIIKEVIEVATYQVLGLPHSTEVIWQENNTTRSLDLNLDALNDRKLGFGSQYIFDNKLYLLLGLSNDVICFYSTDSKETVCFKDVKNFDDLEAKGFKIFKNGIDASIEIKVALLNWMWNFDTHYKIIHNLIEVANLKKRDEVALLAKGGQAKILDISRTTLSERKVNFLDVYQDPQDPYFYYYLIGVNDDYIWFLSEEDKGISYFDDIKTLDDIIKKGFIKKACLFQQPLSLKMSAIEFIKENKDKLMANKVLFFQKLQQLPNEIREDHIDLEIDYKAKLEREVLKLIITHEDKFIALEKKTGSNYQEELLALSKAAAAFKKSNPYNELNLFAAHLRQQFKVNYLSAFTATMKPFCDNLDKLLINYCKERDEIEAVLSTSQGMASVNINKN